MPRAARPVPKPLRNAANALEQWRRSRKGRRSRMPEALWTRAAKLAGRYGVSRTAQALRLNYTRLKELAYGDSAGSSATVRDPSPFVELISSAGHGSECIIDLQRGDGARMRIRIKGSASEDVAALSRVFWEAQA